MTELLGKDSKEDDFENILKSMNLENKYDRPPLEKCIEEFEDILSL